MIDVLKKENTMVCTHIAKDLNGQPHKKRIRREYKDIQNCLRKLSEDRAAGRKTVLELLRGVVHNIRWKPVRMVINYIQLWTINYILAIYLYEIGLAGYCWFVLFCSVDSIFKYFFKYIFTSRPVKKYKTWKQYR